MAIRRDQGPEPLDADAFASAFRDLDLSPGPILAAVSGGPDSTCLMHALAAWAALPGRPTVAVATVDHALRPASRSEAEAVAEAARRLGLSHTILTWAESPAGRVSQARARRARYELLRAHARHIGAHDLVTAHTLDDQAETLLIRMASGSGLSGLAGMRRVSGQHDLRHVRPFLDIAKASLVATCQAWGWDYVEDPSNTDPHFARGRWRGLAPRLAKEGLDATRLARLAQRLARADVALERAAAACLAASCAAGDGTVLRLDARALAAEPAEIALRALGQALAHSRPAASPPLRLERLENCLDAVLAAVAGRRPLRRTMAGQVLALGRDGVLSLLPEPPRRRGRSAPRDPAAVPTPHSLGIEVGRA